MRTTLLSQPRPLLLTLLLVAFLVLPGLTTIGMFLDGTIYAAISRNLSEGVGSFWNPHFSQTLFPEFREHPPLVFWLQSCFFRAFGASFLTERVYDLFVLVLTGLALWKLWSSLAEQSGLDDLSGYFWIGLLCLAVVPKWSWAYRSNMLESTATLFCIVAIWLLIKTFSEHKRSSTLVLSGLAGAFVFLGFLSKGPVVLFVLVCPLIIGPLLTRSTDRLVTVLSSLIGSFAVLGLLLITTLPEAREYFLTYWNHQVVPRTGLHGEGQLILNKLVRKLIPMICIVALIAGLFRRNVLRGLRKSFRPAVAMLMVGASASIPIALSDAAYSHYLLPSLPFYALAFGIAAASIVHSNRGQVPQLFSARPGPGYITLILTMSAIILVFSGLKYGEIRKHPEHFAMLAEVCEQIGHCAGKVIYVESTIFNDWTMHAIAQRHYQLSLARDVEDHAFALLMRASIPPPGFEHRLLETRRWALFERVDRHRHSPNEP